MATVGVDGGSLQADSQPKSVGLVSGLKLIGSQFHSSSEPSEHSHIDAENVHVTQLYDVFQPFSPRSFSA